MVKNVKRLFEQFKPEHYDLKLVFPADKKSFSGKVIIRGLKVGRPSKRLTFHQNSLKISSAKVTFTDKKDRKKSIAINRVNLHKKFDEVRLHSDTLLYPGKYEVELEFSGTINDQMNGIYPCYFNTPANFTSKDIKHLMDVDAMQGADEKQTESYKQYEEGASESATQQRATSISRVSGSAGKQANTIRKMLISTQFESHHAREAFPCIDEPEAKATYQLTLTHPIGETVISNTPVLKQTKSKSESTTVFEKTPVMSSYLLAFVFGDLKYLEKTTKSGIAVRAYATPDNFKHTEFALETAVKCLEFYNEYFAIPYPLKKCDMVALPDFASGAMENWGLITYREQTMLVDPKHTSLSTKQYVAMVVAHELAHQWFGNLVTMRWWTDLWLNEGFASWVEYLAVDHLFPEWDMWTQFITDEQQPALKLDALEHTHPIEAPINHPDEIRTIFDIISYQKGSSVIHMLNNYLGEEDFKNGLRYYLKKYAYKNTDTVDLWQALEEVSGKPVKDFMHAWTTKPGYPIIKADINQDTITLHQERFYLNDGVHSSENELWPVATLANIGGVRDIFTDQKLEQEIDDPLHLKLNSSQAGFYRVVYNASHTHELAKLIRKGQLQPLDRLGLLADAFEAAKAGYVDTDDALDLLEAYNNEQNTAVWDIIVRNLGDIRAILGFDNDLRELMKPYERKLAKSQVERLGWAAKKNESHFDSLLRPTVLGLAAIADDKEIITHALKLFASIKHPDEVPRDIVATATNNDIRQGSVDPDIRGIVYGTAARHGDEKTFDKLFNLHEQTSSSEEKLNLCAALTGFRQPKLIKKALGLIKSDSVRLQDVSYWIAYSFMNRHARDLTWQWLKDNWQWLDKNLGNDLGFGRLPIYAARVHASKDFLEDFNKFFTAKKSPALERSINQGVEMVQWHIKWRKRAEKEALAFFKDRVKTL